MNIIDFSKIGGYRLKQATFEKMQTAYLHVLKAFVTFCKIPDIGNFIISGCNIVGANIEPGYLYIDGELCYFPGSAGTTATKIKKLINITSLNFKNGIDENVFRKTSAIVDASGTALSTFTRVTPVFDSNYIHTDYNFTLELLNKLNGIEPLAEKNVQTNWNELSPVSDAFLIGKPTIVEILRHGTFDGISDIDGAQTRTVNFPDVGTTNYYVIGIMKSRTASDWQGDVTVIWNIKENVTSSSFQLNIREYTSTSQSLVFDYVIIKKPN